ncbi:MAG TPA: SDR family NAD(P)-dependent oxidoreductase [Patescibacteria group bacterium]|nr:SDR family NAD(P)-dependent oxidoreductase [Patescibacteria group bacterium]
MKILVTGGAGFIGSHVVKKLIGLGHKVVVVDNFNNYYEPRLKRDRVKIFLRGLKFKVYEIDIADYKKLERIFKKEKFDKIIHLAAQAGVRYSLENPFVYAETNIVGTLNLLELARHYKVKDFIYASSSSVYGNNKNLPFKESDRVDEPISLYAATKKSTELLAYTYHHLFGINTVGLRFFTVYGPWGRPDMALFKFTKNIIEGKEIEVYGQGAMDRDFTYIDDIVAGIIGTLKVKSGYEIFNLGNSRPEKLMKMIGLIEKNVGKKAKIKMLPMQAGDVRKTYADIKKAKKQLGYQPRINLEEGIRRFVEWYREYYEQKTRSN